MAPRVIKGGRVIIGVSGGEYAVRCFFSAYDAHSTARTLGQTSVGRLQWSPDYRYLLLLDLGACGIGTGYFGTLETLDIDTGQRAAIASSRCEVNHESFGWIIDDVQK
jgi:hypothetical protein